MLWLCRHIYDLISKSEEVKELISTLVKVKKIEILAPDMVVRELENSPFKGHPDWFPSDKITDSTFILDHSRLDFARLGSGDIYEKHKGESNKISDAIIADTAVSDADIFASNDKRCRNRLGNMPSSCTVYDFNDFIKFLKSLN